MGTLCHSWGATGERVEQHVVHVWRKVIDCTRLALPGALSRESVCILGLLRMPGAISPPRTLSACVGYYSERGDYLSRASPIFRCTSASASAGSNGGRNT